MFDNLYQDPKNALLQDRLSRLAEQVRLLSLSTREGYLAEVYSQVNAILSLGSSMSPLVGLAPEGPAIVGDLTENFSRLNRDAGDIAQQTVRVEDIAAQLYNLAATTQSALCQQVRERAFGSNQRRWVEAFLHSRQLASNTGSVDYAAGVCSLAVQQESQVQAQVSVGAASVGVAVVGVEGLSGADLGQPMVWAGSKLELIVQPAEVTIVNRLVLELDDYQGLELTTLTTSPDGTLYEDVLADLGERGLDLNGTTGKYSGKLILDFPPRHIERLRLIIEDRAGEASIALRSLALYQRRYGASAVVQSQPVKAPAGLVKFTSQQQADDLLVSITHQVSSNGVHFTVIQPGDKLTVSSPFWYRAVLERAAGRFDANSTAVVGMGADPLQHPDYELRSSQVRQLGNGILERVLEFTSISGPVKLREVPLGASLVVECGSVQLTGDDYSFAEGILALSQARGSVTVTYQTSSLGPAALTQRREYYSPYLYQIRFERCS